MSSFAIRARDLAQGYNLSELEIKASSFGPYLMSHLPGGRQVTTEDLAYFCRSQGISFSCKSDTTSTLRAYFGQWERAYKKHVSEQAIDFSCSTSGCIARGAHRRCRIGAKSFCIAADVHQAIYGTVPDSVYEAFAAAVQQEKQNGPLDQPLSPASPASRKRVAEDLQDAESSNEKSDIDSAYNTASPLKKPRVEAQPLPDVAVNDLLAFLDLPSVPAPQAQPLPDFDLTDFNLTDFLASFDLSSAAALQVPAVQVPTVDPTWELTMLDLNALLDVHAPTQVPEAPIVSAGDFDLDAFFASLDAPVHEFM